MLKRIHLPTVESTNTWAKEHAHELDPHLTYLITAGEQTEGRGRHGKQWLSTKGKDLIVTAHFVLSAAREDIPWVTQVMALSVVDLLASYHALGAQIKWPNDILIGGKKIAGILCETSTINPGQLSVALGVGLNVNSSRGDLSAIDQPATSLSLETSNEHDLAAITDELSVYFEANLAHFVQSGFTSFEKRFGELLIKR